jgi:hypothetical protein
MTYPLDFPVPQDTGGPGAGAPIGGFGGNPAADRSTHLEVVARVGKAPVLLVHGNGGAADLRPWDLLDQRRFLQAAGYPDELIWAPSYLGAGSVDLQTPHTNNVDDVRDYLEAVCGYLDVDVVDVIAHSLGCTLMYSVFRGLDRQTTPISWNQPKKWSRVGTFVSLAGAFHGLGTGSIGEWRTGGEFMNELLDETEGGGGETPFGAGKPQTPGPTRHTISYFCGTAAGDFVDAQNPGTGSLSGATNRSYNLGSGTQGHQAIKESQAVFNDFLPLLNSVPPVPAVLLTLDRDSGQYPVPLIIAITVDPPDLDVTVTARQLTKQFVNGAVVETVSQDRTETVSDGGTITLDSPGFWQITAGTDGAVDPIDRSYWVGVEQVIATIATDSSVPFDDSLLVTATASDPAAILYYSLDGANWTEGAAVTITQDAVVFFIALTAEGISSEIVSRSYTKRVAWDDAVTASAVNHFIAGRIDVTEYLALSDQFGFFTPFTLYLVDGDWVLDPQQPSAVPAIVAAGERAEAIQSAIRVTAVPEPGDYPVGKLTVTLEAPTVDQSAQNLPVTVYYTRDGSIPTAASASFVGRTQVELPPTGNQVIACLVIGTAGDRSYHVFHYARR